MCHLHELCEARLNPFVLYMMGNIAEASFDRLHLVGGMHLHRLKMGICLAGVIQLMLG